MNAKIYCEHHWVHPHENLNYEVIVRTMAPPGGHRFTSEGMQATHARPLIRVFIGGQCMGVGPLEGNPDITKDFARHYVERNLKSWENVASTALDATESHPEKVS
jgi:hypothetical protein